MDKETLSNYGWIVICVMVLAVMIALATPFGTFVSNAVKNTKNGLFDTSEKGLNSIGITCTDGWVVPYGGTYHAKNGTIYHENNVIPGDYECQVDDVFKKGDYVYTYKFCGFLQENAWSVSLNLEKTDKNKTEYGPIVSEINKSDVREMRYTFANCVNLTKFPQIPDTIQDMTYAFKNCTSLVTAKVPKNIVGLSHTFQGCNSLTTVGDIPSNVTNMYGTFYGCTSLSGTVEINANPSVIEMSFEGINFETQKLKLSGKSRYLEAMGKTGINYCTECNGHCDRTH